MYNLMLWLMYFFVCLSAALFWVIVAVAVWNSFKYNRGLNEKVRAHEQVIAIREGTNGKETIK